MRELNLLSDHPRGIYAEIKALISYPEDEVKRAKYLSNHLKEYYINFLDELINGPEEACPEDIKKGILASVYAFDKQLYNSLGGIQKIMNTDSISKAEQNAIKESQRLVGLCICLLYFGINYKDMFLPHCLISQGRVLKHMCLRKYALIYDIKITEKTIQSYCIKNRAVVHLIAGEFIYLWMSNILQNEINSGDEEAQSFYNHYYKNMYYYILGYAKTLYNWGIDKTIKRRPQKLIDESFSVAIPSWVEAIPLPRQLRDYFLNIIQINAE